MRGGTDGTVHRDGRTRRELHADGDFREGRRKLRDFPVETNAQALVKAVRMIAGHKHLVLEEGLQSSWLYETLSPHVDELVVAGTMQNRGPKSDRR
jgi:hypothetical protein